VSELDSLPLVIKIFPLAGFPPAHYFLNLTLLVDGQER